jgi:ribonuclease BN (tRNA processing enzyme)
MHSLVIIDDSILIDAPPTIIPQLRRAGISTVQITELLITHWHGDHTFGLPFLLLERKFIADRDGDHELVIHCHTGGEEKMRHLCELAYPGSLEDVMSPSGWVSFNEKSPSAVSGTWTQSRFEVCHEPATEPHGYLLENENGFKLVHCGDSGPCENIERLAGECDVMVIELGIPDFVDSPYHYTPARLADLAERNPETRFIATHHFASGKEALAAGAPGFPIPALPGNVMQAEDGDIFEWDGSNLFASN